MRRLLLLPFLLIFTAFSPVFACDATSDCQVKGGIYRVRPPAGWDGRSALPLLVHFPGYQMSADDMMKDKEALAVFDQLGVLVVAAEARGLTWNLPAFGEAQERNEYAYINAVLDDVENRFPVDRTRVLASGFSLGGSMVWYMACEGPKRFTAYVAVAGAFWNPAPKSCRNGPVNLFHIHGLSDTTVPVRGRFIRPRLHQGNVYESLKTLRQVDGCRVPARRLENISLSGGPGGVMCEIDQDCAGNHQIRACFHSGDHYIAGSWYRDAWAFLEQATRVVQNEVQPARAGVTAP